MFQGSDPGAWRWFGVVQLIIEIVNFMLFSDVAYCLITIASIMLFHHLKNTHVAITYYIIVDFAH